MRSLGNTVAPGTSKRATPAGAPSSTRIRTLPEPFETLQDTSTAAFPPVNPLRARNDSTACRAPSTSFSGSGAPLRRRVAAMILAAVRAFCPETSMEEMTGTGRRWNSTSAFPPSSRTNAFTSRKTALPFRRRMDSRTASGDSAIPGLSVTSPASSS